jgi:hypothetical protein
MLMLDRTQRPLAVRERQGFGPPFLAGLLFAALGVVPLSSTEPFTALRVVGLAGLAGVSALLVTLGIPRSRRRTLPGLGAGAAMRASERVAALELDGYALPPTYRVVMVLGDGSRRTVLERNEPAGVLEDATALSDELGLPLSPGWGLDAGALELLARPSEHAPRWEAGAPITLDSPPFAGQRNATWTTLWASAFVLVATILMTESARAKVTPSALSLVLPGIGALLVLGIGIWMVGFRGSLVLGSTGVTRRTFWFGFELGRPEAVELRVAAAAVVVPKGGSVGHLVVSNGRSLFAFPARGGTPQATLLRAAFSPEAAHRAAE